MVIVNAFPVQAYVQMVRLEQQRCEAERQKQEEERKKQKEQARRVSRMLEAAFEGDSNEIKSLMEEVCTNITIVYTCIVHTANLYIMRTLNGDTV